MMLLPPSNIEELFVPIADMRNVTNAEYLKILKRLDKYNFAFYDAETTDTSDTSYLVDFAARFGLSNPDRYHHADDNGVARIEIRDGVNEYPYTHNEMAWHTDGYYNPIDQQVYSMILHCVTPSVSGGESAIVDHRVIHEHLNSIDPEYVEALSQPEIVAFVANGKNIKGPIFSEKAGHLHMRYSGWSNFRWINEGKIIEAARAIKAFLNDPNNPYIVRYTLKENQGIISNNTPHNRTSFGEDSARLLHRIRFHSTIA